MPREVDQNTDVRAVRERDLYLRLLNLGLCDDLEPFVEEALALITEVVGAHQGLLELGGAGTDFEDTPCWSTACGFSDAEVDTLRRVMSRGIIAEALSSGKPIITHSATEDERFEHRESVREGHIEAVVCAPIGHRVTLGAIYLQRRHEPGPFSEQDRAQVELFARHIGPYADRLLARTQSKQRSDPTAPFRQRLRICDVIGSSEALALVLNEASLVAPLDVDVLLTGDSGTGKSQLARIIHDNSPRAGRPLVDLNCAAIPEPLVESELFGALPGSHSTASRRVDGKVQAAQGGTLLLDEVGELSPTAQAKLLQLLQERVYYPLGSTRPVRANLRIIAATNVDLEAHVKDKRFREDLFYRLNVMQIRVPSLAERKQDIADLAHHFCAAACTKHRLRRLTFSAHLLSALKAAEWPGNVRQLSHAIEAGAIRAAGAGLLQIEHDHVFPSEPTLISKHGSPHDERPPTLQGATREFQAQLIRETLEEVGWNVVEAARRLEVARSHLYTLIRAFGIERSRR